MLPPLLDADTDQLDAVKVRFERRLGWLEWARSWIAPQTTELAIELSATSLSIAEHRWLYSELSGLEFQCRPPVTDLVVTTRAAKTHTYVCVRRTGDAKRGCTRRQREWLEEEVRVRIQAAGAPGVVPEALVELIGDRDEPTLTG